MLILFVRKIQFKVKITYLYFSRAIFIQFTYIKIMVTDITTFLFDYILKPINT